MSFVSKIKLHEEDAGDFTIGDTSRTVVETKAVKPIIKTFSTPAKLEPFLLLVKNAKGAAAADLAMKCIGAQGVYVFAEMLDAKGIQALEGNEDHKQKLDLLKLFAYGTWKDYVKNESNLPTLSPIQVSKLKQLTILTLAREDRLISYTTLLSELSLPSVQALEDLLIDAFYSNIITGRLDQKESRLEIISCIGRDVRPMNIAPSTEMEIDGVATTSAIPINEVATPGEAQTLATLTGALTTWLKTIGGLLSSLDYHLAEIQANSINDIKMKNNLDDQINRTLGEIKGKETKELGSLGGSSWTAASPGMGYSAKGPGKILGGGEEEMELDEEIDVKSRRGEKEGNRKSKRARDTKSKD